MSQLATKRGFDGTVHLSNGTTNYPLNDQSSFNSEELIALHWTGLVYLSQGDYSSVLGKEGIQALLQSGCQGESGKRVPAGNELIFLADGHAWLSF